MKLQNSETLTIHGKSKNCLIEIYMLLFALVQGMLLFLKLICIGGAGAVLMLKNLLQEAPLDSVAAGSDNLVVLKIAMLNSFDLAHTGMASEVENQALSEGYSQAHFRPFSGLKCIATMYRVYI